MFLVCGSTSIDIQVIGNLELSKPLEDFIKKCLKERPEERVPAASLVDEDIFKIENIKRL